MFNFLKKCIQIEEPKSVRERALKIFSGIEGLHDIKEMLLRALEIARKSPYTTNRTTCLCKIIIYGRNREANAVQSLLCRGYINHQSRIAEIHWRKSAKRNHNN